MDFKMIKSVTLKILGISEFSKNASGSIYLSEDQKKIITANFGEEFTTKFAESLLAEQSVSADELKMALRAHHSSVVEKELKELSAELAQAQKEKQALEAKLEILADAPEADPKAEFPTNIPRKSGVATKMKVDYKDPLYVAAQNFLQTGVGSAYAGTTIEVTQLKSEFGKYLSQNANNLEMVKQLFCGFTSDKFFTPVPAVTEWRAIRAFVNSVVQQFSPLWNPGGKAKFTPITIKNYRHKINVAIIPAEVIDSYMFKLYDEGLAPDQMPITLYIWNELILPAILQDIEMRMIWKGKFVDRQGSNANGVAATAPEDSMDGLETILVEAKASGDKGIQFFNKYPTFNYKTATNQQILDFINDYVDWISPFYQTTQMPLFLCDDFKRRYKRAYKDKWGMNAAVDGEFGSDRVDYSNQMLTVPDGMYGSPIIFSTPKANMIKLRHKNEVPQVINDVQKVNYEVRLFGEFWLGVGFAIGEAVFAFVPAGYNPKAIINSSFGTHTDYQNYKLDQFGSTTGGI